MNRRWFSAALVLLALGGRVAMAQVARPATPPVRQVDPLLQQMRDIFALADSGHSREAEAAARAGGLRLRVTLADLLMRRGELRVADSLYTAVAAERGSDARPAIAGMAEIASIRGDRETSWRLALDITAAYERGSNWSAIDRLAAGRGYWLLSLGSVSATKAALAAFYAAAEQDPDNVDAALAVADLYLSKYNAPEARENYLDVLKKFPRQSRALLGIARTLVFEGSSEATDAVRAALARNPELAPAWVLLGQLHLEAEAYDSAAAAAKHALAIDSTTSETWGLAGAIAWIKNDTTDYRRAEAEAKKHQPRSADFYIAIADAAARQRRYAEAVVLARTALAVDTLSLGAIDLLATNLLRQGSMDEGRKLFDRSFALNPYNIWNDNTLKLLDLLKKFRTVKSGRFEFVGPVSEIDYLAMYLGPLLDSAYEQFAKRYDYRPPTPIRIELFDRSADFSVRTVAMPGLGALGVSFGPVLVLNSPAASERGSFNYGSTSWHELAHTFTLGSSGFRVPRWISEGLSVLEERRTGRGWGASVTTQFLGALKGGMLHPVSTLNDGFVRPAYPMQLMHSYYQASLVCEMLEQMKGEAGIRAILKGFKDGLDAPAVFRQVLGLSPAALDSTFDKWMRSRFAVPLAVIDASTSPGEATGPYAAAMDRAIEMFMAGHADSAFTALQVAEKLYPGYGGIDGPARWLARYYLDRGDTVSAIKQLARVTMVVEDASDLNENEARLRGAIGDRAGQLTTLERLQWIAPYDPATHLALAAQYEANKDWPRAVLERRAIVALNPADRIEARYQYARVLAASGDRSAARREILAVLEAAPAFEKAQALLLELRGPSVPGGTP